MLSKFNKYNREIHESQVRLVLYGIFFTSSGAGVYAQLIEGAVLGDCKRSGFTFTFNNQYSGWNVRYLVIILGTIRKDIQYHMCNRVLDSQILRK